MFALISQGTQRHDFPNASDFCRVLGVCRRTVLRDMDLLRDDLRAPIAYCPSQKGYYLEDDTWELPALELSRGEVFSFAVARKLLDAFRGTPLEADMVSVLEKIGKAIEGHITVFPESLTQRLSVVTDDYVVVDQDRWNAMAKATERSLRVNMVYQKFDGTVGEYLFEPYHLLAYHGNWYAVGWHVKKARLSTFAVSRIRSLQLTNVRFEIPDRFDPQEHIRKAFGIMRGEKPFRVRLRFSPKVAVYIRERIWHPSQEIIAKRDGSVELRFETAGWKELVRWVLSWQPDCRVLSPKRLRERVERKMREGLSNMQGGCRNMGGRR